VSGLYTLKDALPLYSEYYTFHQSHEVVSYTSFNLGGALVSTGALERLSACQGWSAGLVKSRPNLVGNNEFAMAA